MALWICDTCTTAYAVGLFRCPRCHGTDFHEEGTMPKISVTGGATNAGDGLPVEEPTSTAPEPEPVDEAVESDDIVIEVTDDEDAEVADDEPGPVDEASVPERPALNASKAEWLDYVQALYPGEDLTAVTKAGLIELADSVD